MPYLTSTNLDRTPYYMEAEMNSPMAVLGPGETYAFDTNWFPSRLSGDFTTVTEAGLVGQTTGGAHCRHKIELSGSFGVSFLASSRLSSTTREARNRSGTPDSGSPQEPVVLHQAIAAAKNIARVSIHLIDSNGADRGALGEVFVTINGEGH